MLLDQSSPVNQMISSNSTSPHQLRILFTGRLPDEHPLETSEACSQNRTGTQLSCEYVFKSKTAIRGLFLHLHGPELSIRIHFCSLQAQSRCVYISVSTRDQDRLGFESLGVWFTGSHSVLDVANHMIQRQMGSLLRLYRQDRLESCRSCETRDFGRDGAL